MMTGQVGTSQEFNALVTHTVLIVDHLDRTWVEDDGKLSSVSNQ